jgi:hypothetical protein
VIVRDDRADRAITWLGVALLAAYLGQAVFGLQWAALARWQANDTYRVLSGLVVAWHLYTQWQLATRRRFDPRAAVARHKLLGALAPLVLYLHASRFAPGYLFLLALSYLGVVAVGLGHRRVLARRHAVLFTAWCLVHVATSTLLVALAGYHAVVALAYE